MSSQFKASGVTIVPKVNSTFFVNTKTEYKQSQGKKADIPADASGRIIHSHNSLLKICN